MTCRFSVKFNKGQQGHKSLVELLREQYKLYVNTLIIILNYRMWRQISDHERPDEKGVVIGIYMYTHMHTHTFFFFQSLEVLRCQADG